METISTATIKVYNHYFLKIWLKSEIKFTSLSQPSKIKKTPPACTTILRQKKVSICRTLNLVRWWWCSHDHKAVNEYCFYKAVWNGRKHKDSWLKNVSFKHTDNLRTIWWSDEIIFIAWSDKCCVYVLCWMMGLDLLILHKSSDVPFVCNKNFDCIL